MIVMFTMQFDMRTYKRYEENDLHRIKSTLVGVH
uniref:Uncharacterized protein n=1 Tax=Lepeophtheirus salmonis TaxID=72036 RepID=A0A0K2SZ87_LEPSM